MEPDTRVLEVVCKHFKAECGDETIGNLRKRLNKAHVQNHRLRRKALQLENLLKLERSCRAISNSVLTALLRRMDSLLDQQHADRIGDD